ncbi:peptidylprolyl isomerase [Novosphingobium sp. Chol11]|uniref:peptidylprolyl isomerase n=1 Tax=Novosphingobium sp. Chol11 TaxID=1385763 RepID=UPI0025DF8966|nr:peptidylprolyl isomerase [Novosphingobium sp. Chol11]
MLSFFRSFTKSRIGVFITLVFLGLIALAFAGADISSNTFGGVAGGDRAATVGQTRIDVSELSQSMTRALENARQQSPALTMKEFVEGGAVDEMLSQLADRAALMEWGKRHGFATGERLIDSEITKSPAFKGADGRFSEQAYKQLIAQRGLSEALVRDDFAKGLMARQLLVPASIGARLPREAALRYIALAKESREGSVLLVPSLLFAPKTPPTEAQLAGYYKANVALYTRPESRAIRFVAFDDSVIKDIVQPSDSDVQARYKLGAATYAPSETRSLTQVIVPTEAAAKAFASEIAGGKSIEAAAAAKGLSASKLDKQSRAALLAAASQAVADAAFAAAQGKLAAPAKSGLGWHVIRVDGIARNPGKTFDQAKPEIVAAIIAEKRRSALTDLSAKLEEQFGNGTGLADVAKSLGLSLITTDPILADGTVPGKPPGALSADLAPLVQTAFTMEREGEPQIAEVLPGKRIAIFDVARIVPAAPPPLAEIRAQIAADFARSQGLGAAKAAADKLIAALGKGTSLVDALKSLDTALPPPRDVAISREQVNSMQGRVPPPLALMFAMAGGTAKRLEAPNKEGWLVVHLRKIKLGEVAPNDPVIEQARRELGEAAGQEYAFALRAAMRDEIGVKRNEAGIRAVRTQLLGGQ